MEILSKLTGRRSADLDVRSRAKELVCKSDNIGSSQWYNKDLVPASLAQRKWKMHTYVFFWWASSFNQAEWSIGSSLVAVGLTFRQSMVSVFIGAILCAMAMVLTARPGAKLHIGYPTLLRASFGMWGSKIFVTMRGAVAIIWFGIQTYFASTLFAVALRCIFGHKWTDIPNHLPASAGINTQGLVAFFLVWLFQGPLILIHPSHIYWLWPLKGVLVPPAVVGFFIWAVTSAGADWGIFNTNITVEPAHGAALGWAIVNGINSVMGTLSPMILNQPDIARYARKPSDAGWPQGASMLIIKTSIFFFSISTACATRVLYGEPFWNMWDQLNAVLDHNWNATARTGCFAVAMSMCLGTVGTNLSANSIPFGADMTGLIPKYLTIVRGQILVWILGFAIVPWKFLTSAAKFITFLGSYTVLMGAVLGPLLADYYIVRRGNIHVPSLFDANPGSLYWFVGGFNWRAIAAWCAGTGLTISGIANGYNIGAVGAAAVNLYSLGWILSVSTSAVIYLALSFIFPVPTTPASRPNTTKPFEYLANREGFYDEDLPWDVTASGADPPTRVVSITTNDDGASEDGDKNLKDGIHITTKEV
ncbi:permease for cytosine/purines, uracil, thiamine, allantoin-domain-containing protein [Mycena belliarum]|uniref:Permease for cytosine/purines, uracil, thiamine, allantoin-domain-containing protein n=1 Tax=Mycena belliarum TaxID=1033014 RepID=A0AAD6UA60_9AGAR|nr:permease for cytosine/purines, uracil, thiamine, allantoin-domain-containing protein [Mycena belliae]